MNHRGHREKLRISQCSQEKFPLTYLRAMDKKIGSLINFNVEMLKNGIKRLIMRAQREGFSVFSVVNL
ncbi:MAG: GxxExxY protein [bacterium]